MQGASGAGGEGGCGGGVGGRGSGGGVGGDEGGGEGVGEGGGAGGKALSTCGLGGDGLISRSRSPSIKWYRSLCDLNTSLPRRKKCSIVKPLLT
jgi:hypothetical protein